MRALAVLGAVTLAACATVPVQVSSDGDAALSRCLGTETRFEREPHAAVNPNDPDHIVAAWIAASRNGAVIQAATSFDGGRSWTPPVTLPINHCAGGPFDFLPRASDPWVAFGPEGRAYVSATAFKPTDALDEASGVLVVSSPDGGRTWDPPGVASLSRTPDFLHDNTAVAADPNRPGTAYVVTTRYQPAARMAPAVMSKTVDGGKTWSPVREITPGTPTAGAPQMVIDPRTGHLFVFYNHGPRGSRVSFVKSEDGGETWNPPVPAAQGTPVRQLAKFPGTDKALRVAEDIQHAAIDPETGRLWVVLTTEERHAQIALTTSEDGGRTWSPLRRVNADPDRPAWRPTLAVGPAVFYFAPAGPARGDALPMEVRLATGGKDVVIDRFDWTPAWNGAYFLGDYHALLVTRKGLLPVYGRSVESGSRVTAIERPLAPLH